jgi:putative transposase
MNISEAMKRMKGGSSKWIQSEKLIPGRFQWHDGYAAFSVSPCNVADVARYITNQREHHRTRSFEEEYVAFLEKHEIDYDPKYVWG